MVKTSSSNVGGVGLTPDWRAKIPHASRPKHKTKAKKKKETQKQYHNKFNKDF